MTLAPLLSSIAGETNVWSLELDLPQDVAVQYRYLICSVDPSSENVHVRRFETHTTPRSVPGEASKAEQDSNLDTLGDIDGAVKLDKGWLTSETIIQFKFFDNPFAVKERIKNRLLFVKVGVVLYLLRCAHGFSCAFR